VKIALSIESRTVKVIEAEKRTKGLFIHKAFTISLVILKTFQSSLEGLLSLLSICPRGSSIKVKCSEAKALQPFADFLKEEKGVLISYVLKELSGYPLENIKLKSIPKVTLVMVSERLRIAIINDILLREGDTFDNGVILRIRDDGVVISEKGRLTEIPVEGYKP
jgi:hypothetical protein